MDVTQRSGPPRRWRAGLRHGSYRHSLFHLFTIVAIATILVACSGTPAAAPQATTAPTTVAEAVATSVPAPEPDAPTEAPAVVEATEAPAEAVATSEPTAAPTEAPAASEPTAEPTEVVAGATKANPDAVDVVYWTPFTGISLDALKQIVETFNAANPDVNVKLVRVPNTSVDDAAKLITAVRGGTGPDLYQISRPGIAQRAADGALEDITPLVEQEPDLASKYVDFAWKDSQFEGRQYGLPGDTDARALFYNKDLLTEAGVDLAELDPANGPITLDRLREIAALVDEQDADGNFTRLGFIPRFSQGLWATWFTIFGLENAAPYDAASCQVTPTDPRAVAAFQFIYDWYKQYGPDKIKAFTTAYNRPDAPPQDSPFLSGRLAMMYSGPWEIANIAKYAPDLNYGIAYLPVPEAGDQPRTWAAGWGLVMPKGAKQPEAAYRFMRYAMGEEGQRVFTRLVTNLPTWKSLLDDESLYSPQHAFFAKQLPTAISLPVLPVGVVYFNEFFAAQDAVELNEMEPAAALQRVADRTQPELEQYCP